MFVFYFLSYSIQIYRIVKLTFGNDDADAMIEIIEDPLLCWANKAVAGSQS